MKFEKEEKVQNNKNSSKKNLKGNNQSNSDLLEINNKIKTNKREDIEDKRVLSKQTKNIIN